MLYTNIADFEMDTSKFLARMATLAQLDVDRWQERLRGIASRMGGTLNLGLISASLDRDEFAKVVPQTIGELSNRLPPERWQAPLVLAIDEFQTLGGKDQTRVAKLLMSLHEANYNLPVMLVLGGLGNTVDRAREIGLTRGLTTFGIGCLSDEEAQGLVHGWCCHYEMNPHGHTQRINLLAASTDGWPRHLHFALQALARNLVQPGVDGRLELVDWTGVMNSNMQLRQRYYRHRMSPQMWGSRYLLSAVMQDLEPAEGIIGVERLIRHHGTDAPGWRLPDGMDFGKFCNHIIRAGALQVHDDRVECPIPSFRRFMIEQGRYSPGTAPQE